MKFLISAALAASTLLAPVAMPSVALASVKVAIACPDDAPDAWKRAGGFCEQIQNLNTIGTEKGNGDKPACPTKDGMIQPVDMINGRVHVAGMIDPCYNPCASVGAATFRLLPEGVMSRTDESTELLATPCP